MYLKIHSHCCICVASIVELSTVADILALKSMTAASDKNKKKKMKQKPQMLHAATTGSLLGIDFLNKSWCGAFGMFEHSRMSM